MRILIVVLVCFLAACSRSRRFGHVCTTDYRPGVVVSLVDNETQAVITGATLVLRDGGFEDAMVEGPAGVYQGAHERNGTYELTVTAPGYASRTIRDIDVDSDHCHVITEDVIVTLSKIAVPLITTAVVIVEYVDGELEVTQLIELSDAREMVNSLER